MFRESRCDRIFSDNIIKKISPDFESEKKFENWLNIRWSYKADKKCAKFFGHPVLYCRSVYPWLQHQPSVALKTVTHYNLGLSNPEVLEYGDIFSLGRWLW